MSKALGTQKRLDKAPSICANDFRKTQNPGVFCDSGSRAKEGPITVDAAETPAGCRMKRYCKLIRGVWQRRVLPRSL